MKDRGAITVYLTLMMTVLAAFVLSLAASAREYVSYSEAEAAAENAVRSCFAEYNRELFRRYHILLIDSSYKGEESGPENVEDRFLTYMENSLTGSEICSAKVVSDRSGTDDYMYDQALSYAGTMHAGDDLSEDELYLSYLLSVFGNNESPSDGGFRRGEMEYLLYGEERDENNIALASAEYDESSDGSYEDFLCVRLREKSEEILRQRMGELITEYLRRNGSPGFSLAKSYYYLEFSAEIKGPGSDHTVRTQ